VGLGLNMNLSNSISRSTMKTVGLSTDMLVFFKLLSNRDFIKLLIGLHRGYKKDSNYSPFHLVMALLRLIKNERITSYNGVFVLNSFIPPFPSKPFNQMLAAVPGRESLLFEHVHGSRTAPVSVNIAVTGDCNHHCQYCSAKHMSKEKGLQLAELKTVLAQLQDMGVAIIGLTGGEPTLRKDLTEIIGSIDSRSVSILYSTGQSITLEKAREYKNAGLFAAAISMDHYKEEQHDAYKGVRGSFRTANEAINNCLQAGLYTIMQVLVRKELVSGNELESVLDIGRAHGVSEIRLLDIKIPDYANVRSNGSLLTKDDLKTIKNLQLDANKSRKYPKIASVFYEEDAERFGCSAGIHHSYIDAAGNLNPCDFILQSYGNVTQTPMRELWNKMNARYGLCRDDCRAYKRTGITRKLDDDTDCATALPGFYRILAGCGC